MGKVVFRNSPLDIYPWLRYNLHLHFAIGVAYEFDFQYEKKVHFQGFHLLPCSKKLRVKFCYLKLKIIEVTPLEYLF